MKQKHMLEELSAYIDGESTRPGYIERHLQQCPGCARRHMQLQKMTTHLRALPPAEARPEFATRVIARLSEERAHNWFGLSRPVAATLAVLLVLAVGLLAGNHHRNDRDAHRFIQASAVWNDDEKLVAEFSRLMEAGEDLTLFTGAGAPDPINASDVTVDEVMVSLADKVLEETGTAPDYGEDDLDAVLGTLTPETETALQALLKEYVNEG